MLAKTYSAAIDGVDAYTVEIEVHATGQGEQTSVNMVGLPDTAVKESRDRVRSALISAGFTHPFGNTVIGLAPADIKKEGAAFDLPIALLMIAATGKLKRELLSESMIFGELALNGKVRPIKGALPFAMHARKKGGIKAVLVPAENAEEAAIGSGDIPVFAVDNLLEAVDFFAGRYTKAPCDSGKAAFMIPESTVNCPDFSDVKGQSYTKRALEIAASGGHNVLMIGPPGTGKSMLSRRVPGILPPMHMEEALDTSRIHSIMGTLPSGIPFLTQRPFRAPHHTISDAGLLGGQSIPTPGEISLAHTGVLFLDELPEFKRNVLEVLRQPLETGSVTISRAAGSYTFPARIMLIAAMNPCPCGHYGNIQRPCRCTPPQIHRYRNKISGPLLDRIDIHVELSPLNDDELLSAPASESSREIRERVTAARKKQEERFDGMGIFCNSQMEPAQLQEFCAIDTESRSFLRHTIREQQLSARAYDRILRVARTIADLENSANIALQHLLEAVQYRSIDKKLW
jgi:magnesium chelatase family protein